MSIPGTISLASTTALPADRMPAAIVRRPRDTSHAQLFSDHSQALDASYKEAAVFKDDTTATSRLSALIGTDSYLRWRPRTHLMPRQGWINDPCAVGYHAASQTYHVGFQWNPDDTAWGNISWGAAHSRDLVSWTTSSKPTLVPCREYDSLGIFTGCWVPSSIDGSTDNSNVISVYTAVKHLPIHYTRPYVRGSETIALAISSDAGRSWTRYANNPVVLGPPPDLDVTGWRDPYVAPWTAITALLHHQHQRHEASILSKEAGCTMAKPLYGLLSGGIRGKTPTTFLYEIDGRALDSWRYLGPLIELGLNFSPCPRWVGDFGANWEVCNFVSLSDNASGTSPRNFLICGVEGRLASTEDLLLKGEFMATHAQMWLSGPIDCEEETPRMRYRSGGILDHGAYYAGSSFWDPQTEQQVIFGWLVEDDLPPELRDQQGWAGAMSLPRILKVLVLHSVTGALLSKLEDIGPFEFVTEGDSTTVYTGYSLCMVPDPRLEKLRLGEQSHLILLQGGLLESFFTKPLTTWELKVTFRLGHARGRLGFSILHGHGTFRPPPD
ncbi:uncharacterized protein E0L32_012216 [Thyridium curvatum]|uniref:Glycosyl hydrolase family 32 N-terminal domain-containing protein n=1 Tax=Thyridium curvatum TaxID=1093900 RepID=A0A507BIT2_9PEZI|nr:uncharacterized protein E0L32_012216 [Thyridium curvatum]TPX17329.1 hypothetical protein E0L32_012216 [Thyridium curvatum]